MQISVDLIAGETWLEPDFFTVVAHLEFAVIGAQLAYYAIVHGLPRQRSAAAAKSLSLGNC